MKKRNGELAASFLPHKKEWDFRGTQEQRGSGAIRGGFYLMMQPLTEGTIPYLIVILNKKNEPVLRDTGGIRSGAGL